MEKTFTSMKWMGSRVKRSLGGAEGSCKCMGGDERRCMGRTHVLASAVSATRPGLCCGCDKTCAAAGTWERRALPHHLQALHCCQDERSSFAGVSYFGNVASAD